MADAQFLSHPGEGMMLTSLKYKILFSYGSITNVAAARLS